MFKTFTARIWKNRPLAPVKVLPMLCFMGLAQPVFAISTMRCGNDIIELGYDKYTVQDICGEPESIANRTKVVGTTLHHPHRTLDIQQFEEVQVEEWVYNFGRNRIKEILRFENGLLVDIKDLKRSR